MLSLNRQIEESYKVDVVSTLAAGLLLQHGAPSGSMQKGLLVSTHTRQDGADVKVTISYQVVLVASSQIYLFQLVGHQHRFLGVFQRQLQAVSLLVVTAPVRMGDQ